ncbi:hypothetical protein LshimejAT787_0107240 [Lyophyllum shimeji]|uniref:Uncharacterized protein n=1 Tax=Lyophyllum shimeji TaxID=47721 RepID=A0A9P3PD95_LYOSH|nr:hypothetical protein LshimejAT787_0107240 [Lyophyllum shimeji]
MKAEQQDSVRKPLSPILGSINLSPLSVPYTDTTYLTTLASPPQPRSATPAISPKIRQKPHRPSVRVRRSPAIGPSPLRAMILPDPSDSSITVRTTVSQLGSRNSNTTLNYSRFGLGFSGTLHAATRGVDSTAPRASDGAQDRSKGASSVNEAEDDPNLLLGIIQELVEETSHWDGSLFKDKKFKALIDSSKRQPFQRSEPPSRVLKEDSASSGAGLRDDKSLACDLNLLVPDIFRKHGETFIPDFEVKMRATEDEAGDIVPAWEDQTRRWLDEDPQSGDSVGVAC